MALPFSKTRVTVGEQDNYRGIPKLEPVPGNAGRISAIILGNML